MDLKIYKNPWANLWIFILCDFHLRAAAALLMGSWTGRTSRAFSPLCRYREDFDWWRLKGAGPIRGQHFVCLSRGRSHKRIILLISMEKKTGFPTPLPPVENVVF
jgi:hypothetical protein